MRLRFYLAAIALLSTGLLAHAETITFSGAPYGPSTGSYTEGSFIYSALTGTIFYDDLGNPGVDAEGAEAQGGGVLLIQSTSGSLFTFAGLDYSAYSGNGQGSQTLTVDGLLDGVVVGTTSYTLSNTDNLPYTNWTTESAGLLDGVTLDQLVIQLQAAEAGLSNSENVDNVIVNPVSATPEPSSLILLGTGLLGFAGTLRRRLA